MISFKLTQIKSYSLELFLEILNIVLGLFPSNLVVDEVQRRFQLLLLGCHPLDLCLLLV